MDVPAVNGGWQKLALLLISIIVAAALAWSSEIKHELKTHQVVLKHPRAAWDSDVRDNQENIRSLYYELGVNRAILNQIDKNTGGKGDAPAVRPIRDLDR